MSKLITVEPVISISGLGSYFCEVEGITKRADRKLIFRNNDSGNCKQVILSKKALKELKQLLNSMDELD